MLVKSCLKRRLSVIFLAMAMLLSVMFGMIFMKASASSVNSDSLVAAYGGATVEANRSYTTTDGTYTTSSGLYIHAPADKSAAYSVEFNGIFKGSAGIKAYFPGEGFWGVNKEIVMTVSSISDADAEFQVHIGGEWQQYGVVSYEWEGQTLWRSRGCTAGDLDTFYYTMNGAKDVNHSQFIPAPGHFTDADLGRKTAYFGIEAQADGSTDVVLLSSYGYTYMNRTVIASFKEDAETFEPSAAEMGNTSNLPKLDLSKGYTISFTVSDTDNSKSFDFLVESVATAQTGNPYETGTVYSMNTETLAEAPDFYENWQTIPVIFVADSTYLNSSYVGKEVQLPAASVVLGGKPANFTGTITVKDESGKETEATDGKFTVEKRGEHTVTYTQGGSSVRIVFYAYDQPYALDQVVTAEGASVTYETDVRGLTGITVGASGESAYSGTLAGSFSGDMSIDFEFPQQYTEQNNGNGAQFVFTVYDATGKEAFDVVYENTGGWYTGVYVRMGDKIRSWIEDGSYDGWSGDKGTMFYTVPTGDRCLIYPGTGLMYNEAGKYGTLQLVWEGNVLCVRVSDRNGSMTTIAKFDGSTPYSARELDTQNALVLGMEEERRYGLPLMDGTDAEGADLTNGFSIGFASTAASLPVTFLSVNGVRFANSKNITTDYVFSARVIADDSYVLGNDVYVAEGLHVGTVRRVYSYAFMGGDPAYEGSWGLTHKIFESDFGEFCKETSVGGHEVSIPSDEAGGEWQGMDLNFTLTVEPAWKLSFGLNGGSAKEGSSSQEITYSAHTKFLLSVPDVERAFWQFDGWFTDEGLQSAWNGSFDSFNGDVVLYAKWTDVTPPTVVLADGVKSFEEVLLSAGSFLVSVQDVIASDAAQPAENITLEIRYKKSGDTDYTLLTEDSASISVTQTGTWEIVYTVSDGVNESVSLTRTVSVIERTAPVVTVGTPVTESYVGFAVKADGATAKDADGNSVPVTVTVTDENGVRYELKDGAFTPDKAGVYTVSCTAKDGDLIGYASYSVTVLQDTEKPQISVDFKDCTVKKGTVISLSSATVTDNAYAELTAKVSVTFGTESVEVSGNSFTADRAGVYTVTWTATDGAGNTSSVSAFVTVAPGARSGGCSGNASAVSCLVALAVTALAAACIVLVRRKVK